MKKNALILLVAVAISTVSCVDNAVSPQVEAIRSQQVEWMKAKTAGQVLANANTAALAAYTAASNAITLKGQELTYAQAVAANEEALIDAKYRMALAKGVFDTEMLRLANLAITTGDAKAIAYLDRYTTEASTLATKIAARLLLEGNLVTAELNVKNNPTLEQYLSGLQSQIETKKGDLATQQEILAIYNAGLVGNSTTAFNAERTTLLAQQQVNFSNIIRLEYDTERNTQEINLQTTEVAAKRVLKNDAVTLRNDKIIARSNSTDTDEQDALTLEIDALNVKITKLVAEIAVIDASLVALEKSNDDKLVTIDSLLASNSKINNVVIALNNVIEDLNMNNTYDFNNSMFYVSMDDKARAAKTAIAELETEIADLTADLLVDNTTESIAASKANIVSLTKDIATANVEITAQEKIVAYWKALLDKIFTA